MIGEDIISKSTYNNFTNIIEMTQHLKELHTEKKWSARSDHITIIHYNFIDYHVEEFK